jgi:hypothetical protein
MPDDLQQRLDSISLFKIPEKDRVRVARKDGVSSDWVTRITAVLRPKN